MGLHTPAAVAAAHGHFGQVRRHPLHAFQGGHGLGGRLHSIGKDLLGDGLFLAQAHEQHSGARQAIEVAQQQGGAGLGIEVASLEQSGQGPVGDLVDHAGGHGEFHPVGRGKERHPGAVGAGPVHGLVAGDKFNGFPSLTRVFDFFHAGSNGHDKMPSNGRKPSL